jgi:hypothetical protein
MKRKTLHTPRELMLSKPAQRALIGWETHGPRIITATFRTKKKKINMNAIQCYAPTNERDEDGKDQFYSRLRTIVESCPGRDFTIMMGDFNAKIGNDDTGWEEVMGRHGLGDINDNNLQICVYHTTWSLVEASFVISESIKRRGCHLTKQQRTRLTTCVSTRSSGDISLQDVRIKRGADVASDHHLIVEILKLKLRKN